MHAFLQFIRKAIQIWQHERSPVCFIQSTPWAKGGRLPGQRLVSRLQICFEVWAVSLSRNHPLGLIFMMVFNRTWFSIDQQLRVCFFCAGEEVLLFSEWVVSTGRDSFEGPDIEHLNTSPNHPIHSNTDKDTYKSTCQTPEWSAMFTTNLYIFICSIHIHVNINAYIQWSIFSSIGGNIMDCNGTCAFKHPLLSLMQSWTWDDIIAQLRLAKLSCPKKLFVYVVAWPWQCLKMKLSIMPLQKYNRVTRIYMIISHWGTTYHSTSELWNSRVPAGVTSWLQVHTHFCAMNSATVF